MEEETLFKCQVYWRNWVPKDVRRIGIEKSKALSFDFLNQKLLSIMPGLASTKYTIKWKDNEGDEVSISTDDELKIAVTAMPELVRLIIYCDNTPNSEEAANLDAYNLPAHYGVVCDGCDNVVCGFRYKCTTCDDYDLCSKCEAAGLHPEHCMVRVPEPNMSHSIIRAAVKRSRHFLKTVSSPSEEERCKKRRDPNSEHKRRGDHCHNHFHKHGHRQHSSDREHNRRTRPGWLETFATYMNEFANLAEDVNIEIDKSEPKQTHTQATQSPKEPTSSQIPTANEQPHCPFTPENFDLNNIQEFLKMYFGHLDPTKPFTSKAGSETSPTQNNDVEMGQGDRKSPESDKESLKSDNESVKSDEESVKSDKDSPKSEVSCSESVKNDIPEKIDDWTVINKERDLMDTEEKPNDPTPPIGFNLPEEFQDCVNISGGSLYPKLNAATAVLKPKEPEVKTGTAPATVPGTSSDKAQPSAPPTNVPKAEPRKRHPLRHIDAAIDQMLAMGFTNDGGWLTQILESKNGNIAAVLDLLTPVNPKN